VIDSFKLERDAGGKPVPTFPHPALTRNQKAHCCGVGQGAAGAAEGKDGAGLGALLAAAAGAAGAGLTAVRGRFGAGRRFRFGGSGCSSARSGFGSNRAGEDSMPTKFFSAATAFAVSVRGRWLASVKVAVTSAVAAIGSAQGVRQVPPVERVTSAPEGSDSKFSVIGVGAPPPKPGSDSKDPHPASNRAPITTTATRFIRLTR
jgi:hypothetical protein